MEQVQAQAHGFVPPREGENVPSLVTATRSPPSSSEPDQAGNVPRTSAVGPGGTSAGHSARKRRHEEASRTGGGAGYAGSDPASLDQDTPSPKRSRTAEWPLKDEAPIGAAQASSHVGKSGRKDVRGGSKKAKGRKSMFKEGSLSDKPSRVPPADIIGSEEAMMEDYHRDGGNEKEGRNAAGPLHEAGDKKPAEAATARPSSGIFRFGRALSALFPSNFWGGNGGGKAKEEVMPKFEIDDQRRREEIEKAYRDLKGGGFKGMKTTGVSMNVGDVSAKAGIGEKVDQGRDREATRQSFRDSGIDVVEGSVRSSQEKSLRESQGQSVRNSLQTVEEPAIPPSPGLEMRTRRSFSAIRSPSLQNLKKVTSHLQPSSTRRRAPKPREIPSIDAVLASNGPANTLRPQPSKKDLARMQKLNKRVSDLEAQLQVARQDLQAIAGPGPEAPESTPARVGRKAFVPGALGSLPSERLLSRGLAQQQNKYDNLLDTVPGTPREAQQDSTVSPPMPPDPITSSWLNLSPPKENAGRTPPRRALSSHRSRRANNRADHIHCEASPPPSFADHVPTPPPQQQAKKRLTSPTPNNSPADPRKNETIPRVPSLNKKKKQSAAQHEKAQEKENIRQDSRTASPLPSQRPRSSSFRHSKLSSHKRGTSPPPPSVSSAQKKRKSKNIMGETAKGRTFSLRGGHAATTRNEGGAPPRKEAGVVRVDVEGMVTRAMGRVGQGYGYRKGVDGEVNLDKPLPAIRVEREEYEWGDDVF